MTPDSIESFVDVGEITGAYVSIASDYDDDLIGIGSGDGLAEARVEIDENTTPSLPAGRNPTPAGLDETALGLARGWDTLENMSVISALFDGNEGKRYEISTVSTQSFTMEYNGGGALESSTAIIELMPIQLIVFQGDVNGTPAKVSYTYSVVIDSETIFESSALLTGTYNVNDPTTNRPDASFFQVPEDNAFGMEFPAFVTQVEMGAFEDGGELSGTVQLEMTIEADDSGWGAYIAPTLSDGRNLFVPIPEPNQAVLLGVSLLLAVCRRRGRRG